MKTLKYIFPFALSFFCLTGCEEDERPETLPTVQTKPAEDIQSNSATIKFETQNSSYKGGFYYGDNSDLSNAQVIRSSGGTIQTAKIENLTPLSTYYYQGFIEDRLGNRIQGEIMSFTTEKKLKELWSSISNSKFPGMNYGYHSGFSSDNYFYLWVGKYEDILGEYSIVIRSEWKQQFWRYNIKSNQWERINTSIPGNSPIVYASIYANEGEKGYFLLGETSGSNELQFWMYDGQNNAWTSLPHFPSSIQYNPPIFIYKDFLYVMDRQREIWVYDPIKISWNEIIGSQYPGEGIYDLSWFHYENKLFIGLGRTNNTDWPYTDFWEAEMETSYIKWTQKKDFPGITNEYLGNGFEFNAIGYLIDGSSQKENSWTYDIKKNTWNFIKEHANKRGQYAFKANDTIYLYDKESIWKFNPE